MATVAATLATGLAARGLLRYRVPWSAIVASKNVPQQIVIDFGILLGVLRRRLSGHDVRGRIVTREFRPTGRGPTRAGDVAWRSLPAVFSPNALPIEVDPDEHVSTFHDIVQNRRSEEPA